jgi:hypothetical protein
VIFGALRIPAWAVLGAAGVWIFVLAAGGSGSALWEREVARLRGAYRDSIRRQALLGGAWERGKRLAGLVPGCSGELRGRLEAGAAVSVLHAQLAWEVGPVFLGLLGVGGLLGALFRERLRSGGGYASPTAAYVARMMFSLGILWTVVFSASPIPVSSATLYGAGALSGAGLFLFVGNLPLRL